MQQSQDLEGRLEMRQLSEQSQVLSRASGIPAWYLKRIGQGDTPLMYVDSSPTHLKHLLSAARQQDCVAVGARSIDEAVAKYKKFGGVFQGIAVRCHQAGDSFPEIRLLERIRDFDDTVPLIPYVVEGERFDQLVSAIHQNPLLLNVVPLQYPRAAYDNIAGDVESRAKAQSKATVESEEVITRLVNKRKWSLDLGDVPADRIMVIKVGGSTFDLQRFKDPDVIKDFLRDTVLDYALKHPGDPIILMPGGGQGNDVLKDWRDTNRVEDLYLLNRASARVLKNQADFIYSIFEQFGTHYAKVIDPDIPGSDNSITSEWFKQTPILIVPYVFRSKRIPYDVEQPYRDQATGLIEVEESIVDARNLQNSDPSTILMGEEAGAMRVVFAKDMWDLYPSDPYLPENAGKQQRRLPIISRDDYLLDQCHIDGEVIPFSNEGPDKRKGHVCEGPAVALLGRGYLPPEETSPIEICFIHPRYLDRHRRNPLEDIRAGNFDHISKIAYHYPAGHLS